jgi:hypothetical protein
LLVLGQNENPSIEPLGFEFLEIICQDSKIFRSWIEDVPLPVSRQKIVEVGAPILTSILKGSIARFVV